MSDVLPILWTEGAFLSQQTFQYWESWLLDQQTRLVNALIPDPQGLVHCEYDPDRFRQQQCEIRALICRRQNGDWWIYDPEIMPPLIIALQETELQTLYLWLPHQASCAGLPGYEGSSEQAAFQAYFKRVPDRFDPSRAQELTLGLPQFRLGTEPGDPRWFESWPLARVRRTMNGHYSLDKEFIPQCLCLGGSVQLQDQIQQLIDVLKEQTKTQHADLPLLTETRFDLQEMLRHKTTRPREVYTLLIKLLYRLSLLQGKECPLLPYEHAVMGELIGGTIAKIRICLNQQPDASQVYSLVQKEDQIYAVEKIESQHLQGTQWILGLDLSMHPLESIPRLMSQVRLGSTGSLHQILASALPGVGLIHLSRPPQQIGLRAGYSYFQLDQENPYWKQIREERAWMISFPASIEGSRVTVDLLKE
jgi:type VI secretion system protein ImpJ